MIESVSKQDLSEAWNYWYPLVYGYFYRRLNNRVDVEDLTANTLNSFFTNPNVQNDKGFIWQTARNQLYKYIDSKKTMPQLLDLDENIDFQKQDYQEETHSENTYSEHYRQKISQLLECCKKQLSEQDYNIVSASIVNNQNSTQLGQEYSMNPATIRQKLKRSITKLKKGCTTLWIELAKPASENISQPQQLQI